MLAKVSDACEAGLYAAGFVAYDAAPAFDSALTVKPGGEGPLVLFHLYGSAPAFYKELDPTGGPSQDWSPDIEYAAFADRFAEVKSLLAQGVTYQVNFSFRLKAQADGNLFRTFCGLAADDPPPYASFLRSPHLELASLSPELFMEQANGRVRCKPMKGTAPRGGSREADLQIAEALRRSEKNRAENLMVVDMIRNDLGRIAEVGSVVTPALFEVEPFPTVFQMTSTIEATVGGGLSDLFAALFPCASIVGAPKVSTMREIERLESSPRGLYTGAIGWVAPEGRSRFSVAIRTISALAGSGALSYGVGGGIVWDSECESEWKECLLKAAVLDREAAAWGLIETTRWTPDEGYWLLDAHMERLRVSSAALGVPFSAEAVVENLAEEARTFVEPRRVRLVLLHDGSLELSSTPLGDTPPTITARLAAQPVCSLDPALRFKTTRRRVYERHVSASGADEALLWNEREELTEFCNGNLVVSLDGVLVTPPLECGLLQGTVRTEAVRSGDVIEGVIRVSDLSRVNELFRMNSVRGWQRVELLGDVPN